MLNFIKNNIKIRKSFWVLHIKLLSDGARFFVAKFVASNDSIELVNNFESQNLEELLKKIDTNIPLILIFTGEGVVCKEVERNNYSSINSYNSNENEDFYYFEWQEETLKYISLIRRSNCEDLIVKIEKAGFFINQVFVGPYLIGVFSSFIKQTSTIDFQEKRFSLGNKEIYNVIDIIPNEDTSLIDLGIEKIDAKFVINYAACLLTFIPNDKVKHSIFKSEIDIEDFKFKNLFNKLGAFILFFFFISLFISYLLLSRYNKKILSYQSKMMETEQNINEIKTIEKVIVDKELIINKLGISGKNFHSFYSYAILNILPPTIKLKGFVLNPIIGKVKNDEKMEFHNKEVKISGISSSEFEFNKWLNDLKDFDWINSTKIDVYQNATKEEDYFEVSIFLK
jgi:hypothetical protein